MAFFQRTYRYIVCTCNEMSNVVISDLLVSGSLLYDVHGVICGLSHVRSPGHGPGEGPV